MKTSLKLILMLAGTVVSANVWSMSKNSLSKETIVEEKEKAEPRIIKNIEFPQVVRKCEKLNINEIEPLTNKTFAQLIIEKSKRNELFILARVVTKVENNFVIHYCDAHSINEAIFGNYPIIENDNPLNPINPINNAPIEVINYFTINKDEYLQELNKYLPNVLSNIVIDYEESFKYLCSSFDLFKGDVREDWLNYFYLNCDDYKLHLLQARKYFSLKDSQRSREYYEKVATPEVRSVDLHAWAIASASSGQYYYLGRGGLAASDYQKAKEYYEKVAISEVRNVALYSWAAANTRLGDIYYFGSRLAAPDYKKAREYYEQAATPEVMSVCLDVWVCANTQLGHIYNLGQGLAAPDYQKARECYEKVATPEVRNVNVARWAAANYNLGNIYYFGEGLVAPDYQRAREYFENVAALKVRNVRLSNIWWVCANYNLGDIYYYGKGLAAPNYQRAREYFEKVVTPKVRNITLSRWNYAKNKLEEIEKMGKEVEPKVNKIAN